MKFKVDPIIAAMLVMMAVLFALLAYLLVQPEPRFKVVLTDQGCEAVAQLGRKTAKLPEGCELESVVDLGWNWVSVGEIRVAKAHVVAIRKIQL